MTRKQIERVASEAALRMMFRSDIHPSQQGEALFIEGAEWRINSVWHKPYDVPEVGKNCLIEYMDGDGRVHIRIDKRSEYEWIEACHYDRILRWAYIKDLILTEDERDS